MSQFFLFLGLAFVAMGILIILAARLLGKHGKAKAGMAAGGFIGPVPFGFATSRSMLYLLMAMAVVMAAFLLLSRP